MQKMNQLLEQLCKDYNDETFKPILESDVVAHMYYLWIRQFEKEDASRIHTSTRLGAYAEKNKKFDFVIGERVEKDSTHERDCVERPELVAEVKFISGGGLDSSQRGSHYSTVAEQDFPKLNSIMGKTNYRYEILFDPENYVVDNALYSRRRDVITNRNRLSPGVQVIHLTRNGGKALRMTRLE